MPLFRSRARVLIALALACPSVAVCATPADTAPATGTVAMETAGMLPASEFARRSGLSSPRLSPDGKHLAVRVDDNAGEQHSLVIYQLPDMSITSILRMPKYQVPLRPLWVSNDWLVLQIGKEFGSLDKPLATGEVIATNLDGSRQRYLYGYDNKGRRAATRGSDRGSGYIVGRPDTPNGHVYVRAMPWRQDNRSIVYDIDVPANTRHLIAHMNVYGMDFLIDAAGKAAFAFGTNADFRAVAYRHVEGGWKALDKAQTGASFEPIAFAPGQQHIYALWSRDGGPDELVEQALDGSGRKVLAKDDFASVGDVQWTSAPARPFAVFPEAGARVPVFIAPDLPDAKLYRALQKAFPGQAVDFINFSQDGGMLLFATSSDRDPGTYYLIDTHTHKVSKLFAVAPWIKPDQMGERRSFRFKAGDGRELEAILTFPPGRAHRDLPMVLVPHGGPHGVSDSLRYDEDAQFLATRGYLVLQVNYRGSGGRGAAFRYAGHLKWGTRIQQDLIDSVQWAIDQHYADRQRICVYGASFGGYSALMTPIRAPGLFKCAVGYAGVYDLKMMYKKGDIRTRKVGRSYLTAVIGRDDAELDANSPTHLADRLDVPVLLAHGKADERAPFAQAKAMREALDDAHKPYEWMAVAKEGHGFYSEAHRTEFFTRLQAFLEKHIGPGAPVTPQE